MWCDFALVAMAYLIVKHFLLDFGKLQPPWMFLNKGTYGHPGGFTHAFVHALGSLPIFLWSLSWAHWDPATHWWGMTQPQLLGVLFLGEFFVHYHMDWFKMWISKSRGWSEYRRHDADTSRVERPFLAIYSNSWFILLGVDQLVHYLTYIAMVALWLR